MKKLIKVLGVLLALSIMMFTTTAYATEFIVDETQGQLINVSESEQLDTVAKNYRDSYGFGIYYYCANDVDGNLVDFSEEYYKQYCNNDDNGVLLALTDDKYYVYLKGDAEDMFSDSDDIWSVFFACDTYYNAVATYINYVGTEMVKYYAAQSYTAQSNTDSSSAVLDSSSAVLDSSNSDETLAYNTIKSDGSLVFDYYDLLSADEEAVLEAELDELSSKHGMDIAVVIVDGLDGKTPEAFADDYYDYNGYGQNETNDGVVLMLSMADRDWHFTTTGKAIDVFTDKAQDYIFDDNVLGYFGNDDWIGGFNCYADECDNCLTAFENGKKYPPLKLVDILKFLCIGAVGGIIAAFIFVKSVKNKHKTVNMKAGADDYLVAGSLQLTQSFDSFAYRNVTRVRRSNDSSSGGSSTHTSSSGTSHGGSGGKF